MTNTGEHTDLGPKSAEEYRQTADAHAQELRSFWKRFAVSGLFVIAAVIIVFACLAWFVANNRVQAETGSLSAQGVTFTMTAAGEDKIDKHVGYYERSDRTTGEKQEIAGLSTEHSMTVTLDSNLNNNDADGLYPGSRGVITFTVTPISKNLQGVTIDISRILKTASAVIKESNNSLVATNIDPTTGVEATRVATSGEMSLFNLMRGHLLFFRNGEGGYYSNRITSDRISLSASDFFPKDSSGNALSKETTQPVTVDLYWVWPEYIQNFVLVKDANYYKNLFAEQNPDYAELQTYVNGTGDSHKGNHWNEFYADDVGGISATDVPNLASNMTSTNLARCAELYNNADEYIGTNVKYLQLELNAREVVQ